MSTPLNDYFFEEDEFNYRYDHPGETQQKKKKPYDDNYEEEKVYTSFVPFDYSGMKNGMNDEIAEDMALAIELSMKQQQVDNQYDEEEKQKEDFKDPPFLLRAR